MFLEIELFDGNPVIVFLLKEFGRFGPATSFDVL